MPWLVSNQIPASARSCIRRLRRFATREDGQAVVELALVIPILLVLIIGIVDFGRAVNFWNDENHVAELTARYVAVGTTPTWSNFPTKGSCTQPSDLASLVAYEACLDSPSLGTGVTGNIKVCYPSPAAGAPVTVSVSDTYNWLPLPKVLGGTNPSLAPITLTGTATMRLENQITAGGWIPPSSPSC